METAECDRAFFHECLLKAPRGRGLGEQDQSKCPYSGMSPRVVSFSNPGLSCVGLRCPTQDTRLGVNARTLKGGQKVSAPLLSTVKLKLQKAFQGMSSLSLGLDMATCEHLLFLRSEVQQVQPTFSSPESLFEHTQTPSRSSALSGSSLTRMPLRSCWTQVPLSHCVKKAPNTLLRCHRTSE